MSVFEAPLVWAMLWILMPGAIAPEQGLPAAVPYQDCLEVAGRVAEYWSEATTWARPIIYCEEVTNYGD